MTPTPDPTTPAPQAVPELDVADPMAQIGGPGVDALETGTVESEGAESGSPEPDEQRRRRQVRRTGRSPVRRRLSSLVVALLTSLLTSSASATHVPTTPSAPMSGNRAQAKIHPSADLAAATTAPAPAPPSLATPRRSSPTRSSAMPRTGPCPSRPAST